MIPGASQAIGRLSTCVAQDLVPKAPEAYMATDLALLSGLLSLIGQDYERAADVLVSERQAIAGLLSQSRERMADPGLVARLDAAAAQEAKSLRVSDLADRGDAMLRALIDVHAAVEAAEAAGEAWAGPLNLAIWAFLETFAANRAYAGVFGEPPAASDAA